jgi:Predicted membrane protein
MMFLKRLPTVQEPRLYMALERTYLGYFKLLFVSIGTGLVSERLAVLFLALHYVKLGHFFNELFNVLTWPAIALVFVVGLNFMFDLQHIEKGPPVAAKEIIDPRIYMAAERTFLAWVRTGIGLIAFGFVIEKFDFFSGTTFHHAPYQAGYGRRVLRDGHYFYCPWNHQPDDRWYQFHSHRQEGR